MSESGAAIPPWIEIGSRRPKRKLFTMLWVRGMVCEIIQLSDFLIEGADSEWKRDRTIDVLVLVLRGGVAEEHRAKTAQLLIEFVSLLIDGVGQCGGQAIVSVTISAKQFGAGKSPAPIATCARREKLLVGMILPGKGAPVVGSMGMQNVVALGTQVPPAAHRRQS